MNGATENTASPPGGLRGAGTALYGFVRYVLGRFVGDGCLTGAAALSYTTLISLVPLVAIVAGMLSAFPVFADTRDQLVSDLLGNFVPSVGAEIDYWFRYFAGNAVKTTTIGILALTVSVVLLLAAIEDQLQNIWHVATPRPWVQRLLVYWAILTLGPLLLGVAFSLPSYIDMAERQTGFDAGALFATPWLHWLSRAVTFLLETVAFMLLYGLVPNCPIRWREALAGGVITAGLIDALKLGFVLYIGSLASYRAVYGGAAAIPIFLLWMYVVWGTVLFGAVVAAAVPRWRVDCGGAPPPAAVERLGIGLALLAELAAQTRQGGTLTTIVLARRLGLVPSAAEDDLKALQHSRVIAAAADGGWVLARELASMTLLDIYRALGLPLAETLEGARSFPWQPRIAAAVHRIAVVEASAFERPLSDVLGETRQIRSESAMPEA